MMLALRGSAMALCVAIAGCATGTSHVGQRLILPDGAARYEMQPHQAFAFPQLDNPPPSLPADDALRDLPPTTICVGFAIDEEGRVGRPMPLAQDGCLDPQQAPVLRDAALQAVAQWRYRPAMLCEYADAAARDRDWTGNGCAGDAVRASAVPVSLAYAFTFEARRGRVEVRSGRLGR